MSNRNWAAIVYGRTYNLDFRFITIPHDFSEQDINWASQHILATTHQARNLSSHPRWSLFKNESYCVIGATCMVRDLMGQLGDELTDVMTKDNQGRPLYVFVGYVSQLTQEQELFDFPAYTGEYLAGFFSLYEYVEQVWLVKDYEKNSKQPILSEYQPLNSFLDITSATPSVHEMTQLNNQIRYPQKAFLWPSSSPQNNQLWIAAANSTVPTSICLDIRGKYFPNSPFLNQTVTQLEQFTIVDRHRTVVPTESRLVTSQPTKEKPLIEPKERQSVVSLSQKISAKAKEDIDLTLQHAAKVTSVSQDLINNFTDWSKSHQTETKQLDSQSNEAKNFGFKTKKSPPASSKEDWF